MMTDDIITVMVIDISIIEQNKCTINTLRTGDADLRFYITTVQDG